MAVFALFLCKDQNFQQQSLTHQSYNYGLNNDMSQKVSPKLLRPTMQNTINLKNSSDLGRINQSISFHLLQLHTRQSNNPFTLF